MRERVRQTDLVNDYALCKLLVNSPSSNDLCKLSLFRSHNGGALQ